MANIHIERTRPSDDALSEAWNRVTDEPEVLGVRATRHTEARAWPWQIFVSAMEFVRAEPLQTDLRVGISEALRSVPEVTAVSEEDREVWVLGGNVQGEALVRAVSEVLDLFADPIRAHIRTK